MPSKTPTRQAPTRPSPPTAKALVRGLRTSLARRGLDVQAVLKLRGQLGAAERRVQGRTFSMRDHVRALVLAQLGGRRPWARIGDHLAELDQLFRGYDPAKLRRLDPAKLAERVCELRCGNRGIHLQMRALRGNLSVFSRIARECGSLDDYVTSDEPPAIARELSRPSSLYKLEQVGLPVALEYLRSVGIELARPAALARRMLGPERLGYFAAVPHAKRDAQEFVRQLAAKAGITATELDSLLWLFCAPDQGGICGTDPLCEDCRLARSCAQGERTMPRRKNS